MQITANSWRSDPDGGTFQNSRGEHVRAPILAETDPQRLLDILQISDFAIFDGNNQAIVKEVFQMNPSLQSHQLFDQFDSFLHLKDYSQQEGDLFQTKQTRDFQGPAQKNTASHSAYSSASALQSQVPPNLIDPALLHKTAPDAHSRSSRALSPTLATDGSTDLRTETLPAHQQYDSFAQVHERTQAVHLVPTVPSTTLLPAASQHQVLPSGQAAQLLPTPTANITNAQSQVVPSTPPQAVQAVLGNNPLDIEPTFDLDISDGNYHYGAVRPVSFDSNPIRLSIPRQQWLDRLTIYWRERWPGSNVTFHAFPRNHHLWEFTLQGKMEPGRINHYIYGHPNGGRLRSAKELFNHYVYWLTHDHSSVGCPCPLG
ncbi:hypothetical protein EJ08DRAFT_675335 [Tothia fuscella]|uniref:Cryptic loci regulator 2 N-terminal domain-containing protein n=1 Tax=Tothia fuscella TaxID=1048955 RepID=A0A9P4P250_9PEZI|nr:hypothetical protein EJ08DRAFT_675335 [Tothia fuscella]